MTRLGHDVDGIIAPCVLFSIQPTSILLPLFSQFPVLGCWRTVSTASCLPTSKSLLPLFAIAAVLKVGVVVVLLVLPFPAHVVAFRLILLHLIPFLLFFLDVCSIHSWRRFFFFSRNRAELAER
jgi:hypothetical protein